MTENYDAAFAAFREGWFTGATEQAITSAVENVMREGFGTGQVEAAIRDAVESSFQKTASLESQLAQAVAERDKMRAALEKYGRHARDCESVRTLMCTCGLKEALKLAPLTSEEKPGGGAI